MAALKCCGAGCQPAGRLSIGLSAWHLCYLCDESLEVPLWLTETELFAMLIAPGMPGSSVKVRSGCEGHRAIARTANARRYCEPQRKFHHRPLAPRTRGNIHALRPARLREDDTVSGKRVSTTTRRLGNRFAYWRTGVPTHWRGLGTRRAMPQVMKEEMAFLKYRREVVRAWPESPRKAVFMTGIETRIVSMQLQLLMFAATALQLAPAH